MTTDSAARAQDHPSADELLLFAYDELAPSRVAEVEAHLSHCADCHGQLAVLERARTATDWAAERPRRRSLRWTGVGVGLAAAAVLAAVLLISRNSNDQPVRWTLQLEWSATAGYVAGGRSMVEIDAQLTRLEKESHYGWPE